MSGETIDYRGARVTPDWPERIQQAQRQTTCRPNGVEMSRVKYGDETDDWGANEGPCHDCAVIKGEYHVEGCDVERCPACGGSRWLGCECDWPDEDS